MSKVLELAGKQERLVQASFAAARSWDPDRMRVWYPEMDPAKTVRMARRELARKSCEAFDNNGFIRGLLTTAARLCAKITPRATSGDKEWDTAANKAWDKATGNRLVFDVSGKISGAELPFAVFLTKFKLGDGLIPFAESEAGRPRISFLEGWQIGDDSNQSDKDKWFDGVRVDSTGMARKVRILKDGKKAGDIDLADAIFFAEYERPGQVRGLPATYHLLQDSQDSREIEQFVKGGIKLSHQIGYQIVNSNKASGMPTGLGQGTSRTKRAAGAVGNTTVDALYGRNVITEFGDERVELLHDDRPHPNGIAFLDYLKRQMALGFGVPIEVIWNLSDLGGANTRAVLLATQDFVDHQQQWFRLSVGERLWTWVIAKMWKAGELPDPPKGLEWWKHEWLPGARRSVDFSRDGRTYLEMLERGELSPTRWYGWQGLRAEDEDAQTVADYVRRKQLCDAAEVDIDKVFSPAPGGAGAAKAAEPDPSDTAPGGDADEQKTGEQKQ